jgi:hypothetical protein
MGIFEWIILLLTPLTAPTGMLCFLIGNTVDSILSITKQSGAQTALRRMKTTIGTYNYLPDRISPKRYAHWWLLDRVRAVGFYER